MNKLSIPEFAVLGHPNEGKSSVVSTLTENDQIRVSQVPGETTVSKTYTVKIDGKEIIRFVDTPGFQVPRQTLAWFREYSGDTLLDSFISTFKMDPFFADECELMAPVAKGAGIIYVVDGSRPVRADDLAEMEILRLTGRPRMAVINSKTREKDYTEQWKQEFRKHFNVIRVFNSNEADFFERIRMLESLKAIDQDWEQGIERVIQAFKGEWKKRNRLVCAYITHGLEQAVGFSLSRKLTSTGDPIQLREDLTQAYQKEVKAMEKQMFSRIRSLFRHHLYEYPLPDYSILRQDLFSQQTWEVLGLSKKQLAAAGAVVGGTMGAMVDTAAAGMTFGVFTAIGSALGAGSALVGIRKLVRKGRQGKDRIQVGPNENIQFLYVLMDRALLYYAHITRRPHGRRDLPGPDAGENIKKLGMSGQLTRVQHQTCARFFKTAQGRSLIQGKKTAPAFALLIDSLLVQISGSMSD